MSTRAQIKVKGQGVFIYKHSDGYPEGVLPFLKPFTEAFVKARGQDPEYFVAQYLRHIAIEEHKAAQGSKFYTENPEYSPEKSFLGYGVGTELHFDIEFLYVVDLKTGKIKTKTANFERD